MSRTRSIASCTSRWVRPAIASSSSSTLGSVASARAISSRLRPGVPSDRAGASASLLDADALQHGARPGLGLGAMRGAQKRADHHVLQHRHALEGLRHLEGAGEAERRARLSGGMAVMSWPSNSTLPEVESRSPVRQLKKVDLPAPFGPIRPRISPCSSVTDAASTALKLPKALVTSRASRSMGGSRRGRRRPAFCARLAHSRLIKVRMPPG